MESKRFSPWGDLWVLTAILIGATLVASMLMAVAMMATGTPLSSVASGLTGPWLFASYSLPFVLSIVLGALWLRRRGGVRLKFRASWSDGPLVLLGLVLMTAAGVVIEPLLNLFPAHYLEGLDAMIGTGGWAILTTVVAAPLLEEIFFRGLLLDTLARRWNAMWAVVASAAVFGIIHFNPPQSTNAFVIAIIMGFIYLRSRSLVPVIVIHAINNGLSYLFLELTGSSASDLRGSLGNDTLYTAIYIVCAVILVVGTTLLAVKRTKKGENPLQPETTPQQQATTDE